MRTYSPKASEINRQWRVVDAKGQVLGRLASQVAQILRGKDKPIFAPNQDVGDYVVVINAEQVVLTGNKLDQKRFYHHSGYPGGLRSQTCRTVLEKHPERLVERAVKGMLNRNTLGRQQLAKLKVYAGPTHPHEGQNPTTHELSR